MAVSDDDGQPNGWRRYARSGDTWAGSWRPSAATPPTNGKPMPRPNGRSRAGSASTRWPLPRSHQETPARY